MDLLNLPPELLAIILSFLPAKDACRLRLSCMTFKEIYDQDPFYQKVVQKYAPLTGLWQSLDRKFYGRLLKISFCEISKQIAFVTLIPDPDIRKDIQHSKVVSISLNKTNEVKIIDKFGKPAEIIIHEARTDDNQDVNNVADNELEDTVDTLHHRVDDEDEDVLEIIYSSGYLSTLATTRTRYTRVLTRDWVTKYHRGHNSDLRDSHKYLNTDKSVE